MDDKPDGEPDRSRRGGIGDRISLVIVWSLWAAMTFAAFQYVRQYSRNIPYWDELAMVSVMTGAEPVSFRWAWQQHNEHRPVISRLATAGLYRLFGNDFRVPRYANAALLSAMAASMLTLARRIRGSARVADVVLPLSILNIAQAESVLNGFAMNLILTSALAVVLIGAAGLTRGGDGRTLAACLGVSMVLLPLCGGSGLVMLPPLALWLAGYVSIGWWSATRPGPAARATGLAFLLASAAVVAFYFHGYVRPPHHPGSSSTGEVISSTFMYLSLAIYPRLGVTYWAPAGWMLVAAVSSTLCLLASAGFRSPEERPRALGLIAIILAMICVAVAVGVSRAGLGPVAILSSRYVTLTTPLLSALYLAWLIYGRPVVRRGVHLGLAAMIGLTIPGGLHFSRDYGSYVRHVELRVERCLLARGSAEVLMERACPALFTDRKLVYDLFRMLKVARVGAFARLEEPRVASTPDSWGGAVRR